MRGRRGVCEGKGGALSAVSLYMHVKGVVACLLCESGACICSALSVLSIIILRI